MPTAPAVTRPAPPPIPQRVGGASFARSRAFGGVTSLFGEHFETRLRPHVHSSWVIGVVEQGAVEITSQGIRRIAVQDSVVAIPPFVVHTEIPLVPGGWSFRYVYPHDRIVRDVLSIRGTNAGLSLGATVIVDGALAASVRAYDQTLRNDGDALAAENALVDLVRALGTHDVGSACVLPRARRNVRAVLSMITERPTRTVTLDELASAAGLSPFHFLRVFKADVGLPPYAFFEQVRIAYANEMICAGAHPSSVAYALGYADQSHLTRQFHRGSFTTPGRLSKLATVGTRLIPPRTQPRST